MPKLPAPERVVSNRARPEASALRARPRAQVIIVGGGINGVGTFRDLALQGIDVVLVERGDYCQGASGASSHMIHGGIRYLENGEFRLVHESVVERNRLLKTAPHYVKPLQTTIPIFSTFSGILNAPLRFLTHRAGKPRERGALLIKAGLSLYDFFSRDGGTVPRHQFQGRRATLAKLPQLRPDVKYTATYFDASVHNPERLTLDVLQDGLAAGPHARASNYVAAVAMDDGGVRLRDELTGEEFTLQAEVVVNTTGAWVDETNSAFGSPTHFMGGTKGSHIVLDHPDLLRACAGREIFFEHTDGRIVLIYPIGDRVLVGTTDVAASVSEDAVCTEDEVSYFFELIHHVFPQVNVRRENIVFSFSGIRPLPRHDDMAPGFISRDYRIERAQHPGEESVVFSLVGGKWTTFRAMAEHMSNDVLGELGVSRQTSTVELPIGGGVGYPLGEAARRSWIQSQLGECADPSRGEVLLERYGTRAKHVLSFLNAGEDRPLQSTDELSSRELEYMAAHEQVGHLVDVLLRRTSLAFRGLITAELAAEVAAGLAPHLGWTLAQVDAEIEHASEVLERFHGVRIGAPAATRH
jgi:glycerol-3-phosphate dehydrogenase